MQAWGIFIQTPLDILTFKVFYKNLVPVNVVLSAITFLSGVAIVLFLWWKSKERVSGVEVVVLRLLLSNGYVKGPFYTADSLMN